VTENRNGAVRVRIAEYPRKKAAKHKTRCGGAARRWEKQLDGERNAKGERDRQRAAFV